MKKKSMILAIFLYPNSSSWAFIYPFIMLIKETHLSYPSLVHIQAFTSGQVCLHLAMQRVYCQYFVVRVSTTQSVNVQR